MTKVLVTLGLLWLPLAACSDGGGGAATCGVAGGTQACICTDGASGSQSCLATGAWSVCGCVGAQDTVTGDTNDSVTGDANETTVCTPDCEDRDCGGDGCGGSCGTCDGDDVCSDAGLCECVPACGDRECGDDGCGGMCGACVGGSACTAGACGVSVCLPTCTDGPLCDATGGGETTCIFEAGQDPGRCAFYYPGNRDTCATDADCPSDQACYALAAGGALSCVFKKTEPRGSQRCASDGSCPAGSQCEVVETGTQKVAFVTSTQHAGDLGGMRGADEICAGLAAAAGLTGAFRAWLGQSGYVRTPSRRFTRPFVPYVRTDGERIARNWADLTDASLEVRIELDESGQQVDDGDFGNVWTGVETNGEDAGQSCLAWSSNLASERGLTGKSNRFNDDWTSLTGLPCDVARRLYCFEQ